MSSLDPRVASASCGHFRPCDSVFETGHHCFWLAIATRGFKRQGVRRELSGTEEREPLFQFPLGCFRHSFFRYLACYRKFSFVYLFFKKQAQCVTPFPTFIPVVSSCLPQTGTKILVPCRAISIHNSSRCSLLHKNFTRPESSRAFVRVDVEPAVNKQTRFLDTKHTSHPANMITMVHDSRG